MPRPAAEVDVAPAIDDTNSQARDERSTDERPDALVVADDFIAVDEPLTDVARAETRDAGVTARPRRARWASSIMSRRVHRWLVGTGLVLVGAVSMVLVGALLLARREPSWWRVVKTDDPRAQQIAAELENGFATLLTQARPGTSVGQAIGAEIGKPWKVAIKSSEATAWLNTRLSKWLANQDEGFVWPPEVEELQVEFLDQRIHVGARLRSSDGSHRRVVTARLAPEFRDNGALWLPAERVGIGQLVVPGRWLLPDADDVEALATQAASTEAPSDGQVDQLKELPQARAVLRAFAGDSPVLSNPTIKLGDGRRVRLLALDARDGRLIITCLTERKEPRDETRSAR